MTSSSWDVAFYVTVPDGRRRRLITSLLIH
jgi:hypothetical protein